MKLPVRSGLGQDFLDVFNEVLIRIGEMPEMYGFARVGVRAAQISRFKHVVYF